MNELSQLPGVTVTVRQITLLYREYQYFQDGQYIGRQGVYSEMPGLYRVENFGPTGDLRGGYRITESTITTFDANRTTIHTEANPSYVTPAPAALQPIGFPDHSVMPSALNAAVDGGGAGANANGLSGTGRLLGGVSTGAGIISANTAYQAGDTGGVWTELTASQAGGGVAAATYSGLSGLARLFGFTVSTAGSGGITAFAGVAAFYAEDPIRAGVRSLTNPPNEGYVYSNSQGGDVLNSQPAGWYRPTWVSSNNPDPSSLNSVQLTRQFDAVDSTISARLDIRVRMVAEFTAVEGAGQVGNLAQLSPEMLAAYIQQNPNRPGTHILQAGLNEMRGLEQAAATQQLREDFRQLEIESGNNMSPNGSPYGVTLPIASNATQSWATSTQPGRAVNTIEVANGDGSTTRIRQTVDTSTGRVVAESVHEITDARANPDGRLVGTNDYQTGTSWSLDRQSGQMVQGTLPSSLVLGNDIVFPPRAPSASFITRVDSDHVALVPGGTVSDIVLLQNRAGNPITAADIRTANPERGLNANLTNVPAGASLLVPTRVGDNLVTNLPGGGTQSVNTRSQEITTVVPGANGITTQTTSSTDGEFTRTVRTITYDRNGEITSESRHSLNTLDGTRTEIPLSPAPSPTTGPAISTDSAAPPPADTPLTDEQISIIRGEDATTGGSANSPAPAPILVADAGSLAGGGIVSDAGGGASSTTESTAPVSTSNPPLPVIEPAPNAPEIIVDSAPPASVIPAIPAAPAAPANDFSLNNGLDGAGSGLTPAQQTALANQLDGMGLGGADDLQFFPLPGGGALIQNADGEIVGEIAPRSDGTLSISGNSINPEDGSSGTISNSIDAGGTVQTTAQYTQAQIAQMQQMNQLQGGLGLVNGLLNLENFDDLSGLGQINTLVGLYGDRSTDHYEIDSALRSIYNGYMPISLIKTPSLAKRQDAANDKQWEIAA